MSEILSFETYLLVSKEKFSINVFNKFNKQNLYKNEKIILNHFNEINYELLDDFLNENIFIIEKKLKKFVKSINLIIEFDFFFPIKISVKKDCHGNFLENKDLNYLLQETKEQCQNTLEGHKIVHMIVENYKIDEKSFKYFPEKNKCNNFIIDVCFISIPVIFLNNFDNILKNYHISINQVFSANYLNDFFRDKEKDIFKMAKNITEGCNPNEVLFIQKPMKNRGFFERFFHFFN